MRYSGLAAASLLLYSCSAVYHPNSRNLPMFTEKKEFQASASVFSGFNAQTAYSVSQHFGVMANGMTFKASDQKSDHTFGEFGAGYYLNKEKYYFDAFGGYGMGTTWVKDFVDLNFSSHEEVKGEYYKFFVQPSYAVRDKKMQYGIAARISYVNFSNLISTDAGQSRTLTKNHSVFFEPSIVYRFYYRKIYLTGQVNANWLLTSNDGEIVYPIGQVSIGAGLLLNFTKEETKAKH